MHSIGRRQTIDLKARKKNNSSRKRLVNVDLQTSTPDELFIYASIYYYRSFHAENIPLEGRNYYACVLVGRKRIVNCPLFTGYQLVHR